MIKKSDHLNNKIIAALQKNARVSFAEIGRIVGLTPPAVAERVKKLEDTAVILNIIQRYLILKWGIS